MVGIWHRVPPEVRRQTGWRPLPAARVLGSALRSAAVQGVGSQGAVDAMVGIWHRLPPELGPQTGGARCRRPECLAAGSGPPGSRGWPPYGSACAPLVGIVTGCDRRSMPNRWRALPAARVLGNALRQRRNSARVPTRRNVRPFPGKEPQFLRRGRTLRSETWPVAEASVLASCKEQASTPGRARCLSRTAWGRRAFAWGPAAARVIAGPLEFCRDGRRPRRPRGSM